MFVYIILSLIILVLSLIILIMIKKFIFISNNDIELINFIIDIYIEYCGKLNLYDERKHDIITQKLLILKEKINKK